MAAPIRCFRAGSKTIILHPPFNDSRLLLSITSSVVSNNVREIQQQEKIVLPKKIQRNAYTVLKTLSKTVGKDPTAFPYAYIDDPYLLPRTVSERRRYLLSKESGKRTACYIQHKYPALFSAYQHDEPRIESYHPQAGEYKIEGVSETALLERIIRRDVTDALALHKLLADAGVKVSLATNNELLGLLCYYDNTDPPSEFHGIETSLLVEGQQKEVDDNSSSEVMVEELNQQWINGNPAEKLFESMEDKDAYSYSTMLRGMVKHQAFSKAFLLYNEMQEKGIQTDVHAYTRLLHAAAFIRHDHGHKWQIMEQLLQQMQLEGVRPNLSTFNTVLERLLRMGAKGRQKAVPTISEMKAIGVEPSLGTYGLLISIFYKDNLPPTDMLYDIMDTIEGQHFPLQHHTDVYFFKNAMHVCLTLKDVELAYRVDELLNTGENCRLLGNQYLQNIYYSKFLQLICSMDSADNMMAYYKKLVPTILFPSATVYIEMLRSVETAMAYNKIPAIWEDISMYGQRYRQDLTNTLLEVMANAIDVDAEIHKLFVNVTLDVITSFKESTNKREIPLRWTPSNLSHTLSIFIHCQDLKSARQVLMLFKSNQIKPSSGLLEKFVDACIKDQDKSMAFELLKLAVTSSLTLAPNLAQKMKTQLKLTDGDRKLIDDILTDDDFVE